DIETDMSRMYWPGKSSSDYVMVSKSRRSLDMIQWHDRFSTTMRHLYTKDDTRRYLRPEEEQKLQRYYATVELDVVSTLIQPMHLHLWADDTNWVPPESRANQRAWTDDFSNILSIFRWR